MITYPDTRYIQRIVTEMKERTQNLPLYQGGPAVDYTHAQHAYALNATLLYDPLRRNTLELVGRGPSREAQILLVERASGHGVVGSFSGVGGYIDRPTVRPDPIAHTLREEFTEECGFTSQSFGLVDFFAGDPTVEARIFKPGAHITVVPVLGICTALPPITVNKAELSSYRWVNLGLVKRMKKLSRGYLPVTLPAALAAIGLRKEHLAQLL